MIEVKVVGNDEFQNELNRLARWLKKDKEEASKLKGKNASIEDVKNKKL